MITLIQLINSFPMELHMVFYKKQYRNIRSAMENSDGLAVLAFFFNVSFVPLLFLARQREIKCGMVCNK